MIREPGDLPSRQDIRPPAGRERSIILTTTPPEGSPLPSSPTTTLLVCVNCRAEGEVEGEPRAGRRLHDALSAQAGDDIRVVGVECLSVCKRPVTIGFSGEGKWTYLYGEFGLDQTDEILATARLYGETQDGLIPWKSRPAAFKQGVVVRIPPLGSLSQEAK